MNTTINSIEELKQHLNLTDDELNWHESPISVPLKITEHYLALINPNDPNDPLRRQVVPSAKENLALEAESDDPLEEISHSKNARLIHRYSNRVAFLATDICPMYCRHCFRRRFTGNLLGSASKTDILEATSYLASHPEIKEMLITGGDPLTISNKELDFMIETFRKASPHLIIRICTRFPVSQPSRINKALIEMLKKHNTAPFYLLTQFNHPRELTKESIEAVSLFVDAGIPALNQTVLLRGVNDNVPVLEELCNSLLFNRIKPYYLFQGDMVTGTAGFRVPLKEGLAIEKELRRRLSGLAMPLYSADLPQGGGKVPLCGSYIETAPSGDRGTWLFRTLDGDHRLLKDPD